MGSQSILGWVFSAPRHKVRAWLPSGPLYVSRQKSVLTEVANRTHGCVSPTDSGERVVQAFARELGVTLRFDQPAAPRMPI